MVSREQLLTSYESRWRRINAAEWSERLGYFSEDCRFSNSAMAGTLGGKAQLTEFANTLPDGVNIAEWHAIDWPQTDRELAGTSGTRC